MRVIPASLIHSLDMASKDDCSDALTIWQAAQLPGLHTVCPRDERTQALTGFIVTRELPLRALAQHAGCLRSLLYDLGVFRKLKLSDVVIRK